jgi:hypothetical protein
MGSSGRLCYGCFAVQPRKRGMLPSRWTPALKGSFFLCMSSNLDFSAGGWGRATMAASTVRDGRGYLEGIGRQMLGWVSRCGVLGFSTYWYV